MLISEQEMEVAVRELRRAAYHEAAHKVICERFGGRAHAWVWANDAERVKEGEKAWIGRCRIDWPWEVNAERNAAGIKQVREPVYSQEYICMAGMIAELILGDLDHGTEYESGTDAAWFIAYNLRSMIEDGSASETDLRGMGVSFDEDNGEIVGLRNGLVLTCARMVREEWQKIVTEADRLLTEASLGKIFTSDLGVTL